MDSLIPFAHRQSPSLNERQDVMKLRMNCTIVGEWEKLNHQPHGLILICHRHSHYVKTTGLK